MTRVSIQPSGVGASVLGFDARRASLNGIDHLKQLLHRHRVVVLPEQVLTDRQLYDFAHQFGQPFVAPDGSPVLGSSSSDLPLTVVGNQAGEYTRSYLGHQEVLPHSDHQWLRHPSGMSLLYAIDIEEGSAGTVWTDMISAYARLERATQERIGDLRIVTFNPFFRPFGSVSAKYVDRDRDVPPGPTWPHPLVRTHPVTGEKILYLHAAYEMEFPGLVPAEGEALMAHLHDHVRRRAASYAHRWQNGDLVLWDNRATLHYRPAFDGAVRRVLKRMSLAGEEPR